MLDFSVFVLQSFMYSCVYSFFNHSCTHVCPLQPLDMAPEPPAGGFLDVTAAEMERVLNSQMLILFAPHAVEPRTQLPLLLATLRRTQPPLRHAAAATLRHLAERDPQGVLPAHVERALLSALDVETSGATVTQLQATLQVRVAVMAA